MTLRRGSGLVEAVIAIAIFVASIGTIAALVIGAGTVQRRGVEREKALLLAEEGIEAVRSIRDRSWASMVTGTRGVVVSSTNMWEFFGSSDVTDGYTRTVQIAASGTTAYRVTSTVSWAFSGAVSGTVSLATVLSDWQTSYDPGGGDTGCSPANWATSLLRATVNLSGTDDALSVAATGSLVFVGRSIGTQELTIVDVSSSTAPVVLSTLDLASDNANALALSTTGTYLYVGGAGTEVVVVNYASTTAPTVAGSLNLSGTNDVRGLAVSGTHLYVTRDFVAADPEFVVVNVINPNAPTLLGSAQGSGGFWGVAASDIPSQGYAYTGSSENGAEFRVANVINPAAPTIAASLNFGGNENMRDVVTSGTIAFASSLSRLTAGQGEVQVVNVNIPTTPVSLAQIEYGANVNALHRGDGVIFAASASSTREFSVIDATNPALPSIISGLNLTTTGNNVKGVNCRAYVVTSGNSDELYVIEPGS